MLYTNPQCLKCKHDMNAPCTIGKSPACKKYPNGRPKGVFYESKNCAKFEPKTSTKSGSKKKKRK